MYKISLKYVQNKFEVCTKKFEVCTKKFEICTTYRRYRIGRNKNRIFNRYALLKKVR